MKNILYLSAILFALSTQAGSLKMPPGSNITRNAGQSIPITFTGSGWLPGQTAQVWLMNAQTWVSTLVWVDQPLLNGANTLTLDIPWAWADPGRYLVRVVSGSAIATTTWYVNIRSAIKYPYFGSRYYRGATGSVTWVTDNCLGEFMAVTLTSESTGQDWDLLNDYYTVSPTDGRYEFNVPAEAPPGYYRIYLDSYGIGMDWDDEFQDYWYFTELVASTRSERIVLQ